MQTGCCRDHAQSNAGRTDGNLDPCQDPRQDACQGIAPDAAVKAMMGVKVPASIASVGIVSWLAGSRADGRTSNATIPDGKRGLTAWTALLACSMNEMRRHVTDGVRKVQTDQKFDPKMTQFLFDCTLTLGNLPGPSPHSFPKFRGNRTNAAVRKLKIFAQ
jgi:hypothetical protein